MDSRERQERTPQAGQRQVLCLLLTNQINKFACQGKPSRSVAGLDRLQEGHALAALDLLPVLEHRSAKAGLVTIADRAGHLVEDIGNDGVCRQQYLFRLGMRAGFKQKITKL